MPTLVCTVLPTFNERDNIAQLIDGVLENAITPHCVIVVDDNSPDGTADVVRDAARRWNRQASPHALSLISAWAKKGSPLPFRRALTWRSTLLAPTW